MRKYIPYILIISFIFLLVPTAHVVSYARDWVVYYEHRVAKNPDDAEANFLLGEAYYNARKYTKAVQSYEWAIRIDPDDSRYYMGLGAAYSYLFKYKEAAEAYKQAIRIGPEDKWAHHQLGSVYNFLNDRDSALEQYTILKKLGTVLADKLLIAIKDLDEKRNRK